MLQENEIIKNTQSRLMILVSLNFIIILAGQERYRSLTKSLLQGSHAAIIVFDVTDENSFRKVEDWYSDVEEKIGTTIPTLIVGNKMDLVLNNKIEF
jgi:Ras-related protein Rab-21